MNKLGFLQYNAPVTLTFGLIALMALVLGGITDNGSTLLLFSVYRSSPADPLTYIRLFGHVFGHSGWGHFFNNFLILLLIGPMLEERHGTKNLIYVIAFTALITGIVHIIFSPNTVLLGASGIVFMFMILAGFTNLRQGRIPITLILVVILFLGREFVDGFRLDDNVSRATHIVGGICGAGFGFFLNKDALKKSNP
ncbi:MAG: rhomboid family intramembrane serine protease [Defluviitaleaceae bacterium]|nr:rhomboid family intramembrane serine protease [Defluviitaleaceae bacterium]